MKRLLCFLPLALLFLGCSDDDKATNPTTPKEIWPLKVGNQWAYENTELDSAGHVISVDTSVIAVEKDTMIQNERWYITTVNGARDPEMFPGTTRSDGMWGWDGTSGLLAFKYPAAVNDTFMAGNQVVIVESIHDTVTVPAGTFICYNYKWPEPPSSSRPYQFYYLSPGVGLVKTEEYRKAAGGQIYLNIRMALISYALR